MNLKQIFFNTLKKDCKWFDICGNKEYFKISNVCSDCSSHRCWVCGRWFYDIENEHRYCNGQD